MDAAPRELWVDADAELQPQVRAVRERLDEMVERQ